MVAVLLVEDNDDVRESLAETLEAEGHAVVQASAARTALALLERPGAPEVVLVDLRMPVMDGLSFVEAMRARADRDRFRIILMSADRAVTRLSDVPGVAAVLEKPFDLQQLLSLLERS